MHFFTSSFNININKISNNKIIINTSNIDVNFNLDPYKIISPLINEYNELNVEFINFNSKTKNKDFSIILTINNSSSELDIINPEENHLYYLNEYNKEISNSILLKYNIIAISMIGLIIKEILYEDYHIKFFTHINSIKNVYDKVNDYNNLFNDIKFITQDKMPIVDLRAKQLMIKQINKAIHDKHPIGGSLETIIYGLPKGIGKPYFNLFEPTLCNFLYMIPGLKSVEFSNVYTINYTITKPYSNLKFINDRVNIDSNVYYGIEQGISTKDIVKYNTHFLPPYYYNNESTSINYLTLENVFIKKTKSEYFNLHKKITIVEAMSAIAVYKLLKD